MREERQRDPFSPVVAAATVIVGVLCFVGFVVVFALARGPGARDGGTHALSRSTVGFAGVVALLRDTGTPVVVSRSSRLHDTPGAGLLMLTPPPGKAVPEDVDDQVPADAELLVLPKWRTEALDSHPGWVEAAGLLPSSAVTGVLPKEAGAVVLSRRDGKGAHALSPGKDSEAKMFRSGLDIPEVDRLQVLDRGRLSPVLQDAAGGIVLGRVGALYVLSDPDLLNNGGLRTEKGAEAAVALLSRLADGGTVAFDLSLNGYGHGHDPLRALFVPPLLGATLCAGAAAALLGLLSAVRFGPAQRARRAFDLGKAALAANSAALLLRAGRDARLAVPYAAVVRTRVARSLRLPRRLPPGEVDAALDRVARARAPGAERWPALLDAAGAVRDRAGMLDAAERLHRWKEEVERGHR